MKYNTKFTEVNINFFKNCLLALNKNFLMLINKEAHIDWEAPFTVVKIENGFTYNDIENKYNIDITTPRSNINYYFLAECDVTWNAKTTKTYYINNDYISNYIYKNNKFIYNPIRVVNDDENEKGFKIYQTMKGRTEFDILRKYPKIEKNKNIKNVVFYLIYQAKKTAKRPKHEPNEKVDRFVYDTKSYNGDYWHYNKEFKIYDRFNYNIDKSGYMNSHIIDLKNQAYFLRVENRKKKVEAFNFDSCIMKAYNIKNDIVNSFKRFSTNASTSYDFKLLCDISNYINKKLNNIDTLINKMFNKKFDDLELFESQFINTCCYNFDKIINECKETILRDQIEKNVSKILNNRYFYLSYSDKNLIKNDEFIEYKNTIEGIDFNYKYIYKNEKIFSYEKIEG